MKNFRNSTKSFIIRPEKSFTHWITSLLIFSFVMMPFVHFHPAIQHFDNNGTHFFRGKVDILSFSEESATAGEHGIAMEIAEAPEIKHLFQPKRTKKLDFFLSATTFTKQFHFVAASFLSNGNTILVPQKNHYHFPSSLSPPVSLA